ncbi:hypothetical protein BRADI_5g01173v3 [Brachypodium distachyon]|uniref:Uncharacterized protein n=1 Tax=Brachypodium distachyon TaxID=15368 RepID=A0A0Q3H0G3_BRADI|nr:hypothetical protein BRADI_5g01173v3 [Brachypodium distachyon]
MRSPSLKERLGIDRIVVSKQNRWGPHVRCHVSSGPRLLHHGAAPRPGRQGDRPNTRIPTRPPPLPPQDQRLRPRRPRGVPLPRGAARSLPPWPPPHAPPPRLPPAAGGGGGGHRPSLPVRLTVCNLLPAASSPPVIGAPARSASASAPAGPSATPTPSETAPRTGCFVKRLR